MGNRREFIRKSLLGTGSAMMLGGIPLRSFGSGLPSSTNFLNKKKLVIIQLHGGNDGLNYFPPAVGTAEREVYVYKRPRISLPASGRRSTLSLGVNQPLSLHPDMIGLKQLWDENKVAIIPGVSTQQNNASHFRGRDIRAMGGGFNDFYSSGWFGRYLEYELDRSGTVSFNDFPENFPNTSFPDPLALELGAFTPSLPFHLRGTLPASIAINGPEQFENLVNNLDGINDNETLGTSDKVGFPPPLLESSEMSEYYSQMDWLINLENDADNYSERIAEIYNTGGGSSRAAGTYPDKYPFQANQKNNPIAENLRIIATLMNGGIDTKVFLVRIGGFDTHANQVESYDSTLGEHAAKAYHLSQALAAFQKDLADIGCEDDVITITTTEFGRQIADNGFGTDHGNASYDLVVGKGVNGGVGENQNEGGSSHAPDETELLENNELSYQVDYRRIYKTILKEWFDVPEDKIDAIIDPDSSQTDRDQWSNADSVDYLPFLGNTTTSSSSVKQTLFSGVRMDTPYPNPVVDTAIMNIYSPYEGYFSLSLYNKRGQLVKNFFTDSSFNQGEQTITINLSDLRADQYILQLSSESMKKSITLLKI